MSIALIRSTRASSGWSRSTLPGSCSCETRRGGPPTTRRERRQAARGAGAVRNRPARRRRRRPLPDQQPRWGAPDGRLRPKPAPVGGRRAGRPPETVSRDWTSGRSGAGQRLRPDPRPGCARRRATRRRRTATRQSVGDRPEVRALHGLAIGEIARTDLEYLEWARSDVELGWGSYGDELSDQVRGGAGAAAWPPSDHGSTATACSEGAEAKFRGRYHSARVWRMLIDWRMPPTPPRG